MPSAVYVDGTITGLARTVFTHRIRPYNWSFPCQNYCICTIYTQYIPMVLANPTHFTFPGAATANTNHLIFLIPVLSKFVQHKADPTCHRRAVLASA